MKLDTTKPLKTRSGETVVLISIDGRDYGYPFIGYKGEDTYLSYWTTEGLYHSMAPGDHDLVYDVPAVEAWFNCYADGRMIRYASKEEADDSATRTRIACIKVAYQEGQYD